MSSYQSYCCIAAQVALIPLCRDCVDKLQGGKQKAHESALLFHFARKPRFHVTVENEISCKSCPNSGAPSFSTASRRSGHPAKIVIGLLRRDCVEQLLGEKQSLRESALHFRFTCQPRFDVTVEHEISCISRFNSGERSFSTVSRQNGRTIKLAAKQHDSTLDPL